MADFGLKADDSVPVKPAVNTNLLASIKPWTTPRPTVNIAESDKVAATAGFTSREPVPSGEVYVRPLRQKRKPEQTSSLSMRLPVSIHLRFRDFADNLKLSYPAALEKLLDDNEVLSRLTSER